HQVSHPLHSNLNSFSPASITPKVHSTEVPMVTLSQADRTLRRRGRSAASLTYGPPWFFLLMTGDTANCRNNLITYRQHK
ncbi:hypothetical protein AVEN_267423-1, partial [Araneus ventricosus]